MAFIGAAVMKLIKKLASVFRRLEFLLINIAASIQVKKIEIKELDDYQVTSLNSDNKAGAFNVYEKYSSAKKMSLQNKATWTLLGNKFCFVAEDNEGNVIGVALYYVNKRDKKDGTIHACFSGVTENARGKGVATQLRSRAIKHFKENGFKGISSRVSLSNQKSLSVNLKLGFEPMETYYDESMQEERHYLVRWF